MKHYRRYHDEILSRLSAAKGTDKPILFKDLKGYIGTSYDFIGLSVPAMRKVFKTGYSFTGSVKPKELLIWDDLWKNSQVFEVMSQALSFLTRALPDETPEAAWDLSRKWVRKIDNWAHSDELSAIYASLLETDPGMVLPQLQEWNGSRHPWERRQSLVSLIEYSKKRKRVLPAVTLLGMVAPLLHDDHYYVQKGVGWTLREIGNVYPKEALRFLEEHIEDIRPPAFGPAVEKLDPKTKERLKQRRKRRKRASQK